MKFIYFTDIHLCEGRDSRRGFERCLDSMLSHQPQLLINGGDLGITPEAISLYDELTEEVPVPILHSNGNHEMCSGYLSRDRAGTAHNSADIGGAHFAILDVIRYFDPTEAHPNNWHALADDALLEWLANDLSDLDPQRPLFVPAYGVDNYVDVAAAMQARLAADGWEVVGAQDFARLGRQAAPGRRGR